MKYTICDSCKKEFEWKHSSYNYSISKYHFCDRACYYEWRKDIKNHPHWNGGEVKMLGYVFVKVKDHPYANECDYVKRSRLVMEKFLDRYLTPDEVMHHINENREDDRIENLMLLPGLSEHGKCEHSKIWTKKSNQLVLNTV